MKRYKVLAAAILIELLFGFQYTWAIFDRILQDKHGSSASATQFVFSSAIVCFAGGMVFAAKIMNRIGPRASTRLGAVIYGAGLVIAGAGGARIGTLILGAGMMMGAGIAFGYLAPLVTAVKWFPRRKGIVTGLVVGAFGSGAFFLGSATKWLLSLGADPFGILIGLGIGCAAGIMLLSYAVEEPEETDGRTAEERGRLPRGLLRTGFFWALVVGLFSGTFAGLSVIGSVEKIGETLGAPEGYFKYGVLVLAVGNALGRAGWGVLVEWMGARRAVAADLALQAACVTAMVFAGHYGPAFVVLAFMIGFNYGGNFVLYVTEVAHTYGPDKVASVYGLIYVVYVVSGLTGPSAAGASYDHWRTYVPSMGLAAAVALAGAAGFVALYKRPAAEG